MLATIEPHGHGRCLWAPKQYRSSSQMTRFREWIAEREGVELKDYWALHRWSIENLTSFWEAMFEYFEIESATPYKSVLSDGPMWDVRWFEGASVNFAQHILRAMEQEPDRTALIVGNESGELRHVSRRQLVDDVAAFAAWMRSAGIGKGSRVAAYVINNAEAVIAFLACVSIGATWSSVSPDFGVDATRDRLTQFEPDLLIATDGYVFNGRAFDRRDAVNTILEEVPSIAHVVHVPSAHWVNDSSCFTGLTTQWEQAIEEGRGQPLSFEQVAFDHPLIVCFSSGTTGKPKGIVHGHGGITLEAFKISALHGDIGPDDVCTMFTTTGWMVWFLAISTMVTGAALGLLDGSPLARDGSAIWRFLESSRSTFLCISSAFLTGRMQDGDRPNDRFDLSSLRTVVFGASPATPEAMKWVADHVGNDVLVGTASGGTEIFTCFVGYCPDLPSYAGEFQCPWLGTDVVAMSDDRRVLHGEIGELIVRQPMPTMPIHFLDDPEKKRLRAAYFEDFPGYWRHGDLFISLEDGTSRILGRSDATLNRGGVRIGTAEIYDVVEADKAISDSLVVNVEAQDGTSCMWLFVVMAEGNTLTSEVRARIVDALRRQASPRHVPDKFREVSTIPYNITGKKLEVPVKRLLMGEDPSAVINRGIMRDPGAIDAFLAVAAEKLRC